MRSDEIIMQNAYIRYQNAKLIQEANMSVFLHACGAKATGSEFNFIEEAGSFGDSVKNAWDKFVQFIKKVFEKFIGGLTQFFAGDKAWLDRYKDIILKKEVDQDATISNCKNFQEALRRIPLTTVPALNYESMKDDLKNKDTFISKYFPDMNKYKAESFPDGYEEKLTDGMKNYFLGGKTIDEKKMSELNFTDIFNFCYNQEKLTEYIKKDQKTIDSSTTSAKNAIEAAIKATDQNQAETSTAPENGGGSNNGDNKPKEGGNDDNPSDNNEIIKQHNGYIEEMKKEQKTKSALERILDTVKGWFNGNSSVKVNLTGDGDNINNGETGKVTDISANGDNVSINVKKETAGSNQNNNAPQAQVTAQQASANIIDKIIYTDYFLEDGQKINTKGNGSSNGSGSPTSSSSGATSKEYLNANKSNIAGNTNRAADSYNGAQLKGDKDTDTALKIVQDNIKIYSDTCSSIFSAKASAIKELYTDFMDILKSHVNSVIGREDEVNNTAQASSTNYNAVYTPARMIALDNAAQAVAQNNNDSTKNNLVTVVKQIWQSKFTTNTNESEYDASVRYYKQFVTAYTSQHPEDKDKYPTRL